MRSGKGSMWWGNVIISRKFLGFILAFTSVITSFAIASKDHYHILAVESELEPNNKVTSYKDKMRGFL